MLGGRDGFDAYPDVSIALDAAGGRNVEVLSPAIGRQLLARGLIDEIDVPIAPAATR